MDPKDLLLSSLSINIMQKGVHNPLQNHNCLRVGHIFRRRVKSRLLPGVRCRLSRNMWVWNKLKALARPLPVLCITQIGRNQPPSRASKSSYSIPVYLVSGRRNVLISEWVVVKQVYGGSPSNVDEGICLTGVLRTGRSPTGLLIPLWVGLVVVLVSYGACRRGRLQTNALLPPMRRSSMWCVHKWPKRLPYQRYDAVLTRLWIAKCEYSTRSSVFD